MRVGRVLSSCAASLAVAGCAVVAIGMSHAAGKTAASAPDSFVMPTATPRPVVVAQPSTTLAPTPVRPPASTARSSTSVAARSTAAAAITRPAPTRPAVAPTSRASVAPATPAGQPRPRATPHPTVKPAPKPRGVALPLHYSTGSATRVITVTAHSTHSTTATLQAWTKAAGGGWLKYGGGVSAHVGSDGLSTHPSESRSATPIGSYTLTQAFGHNSDPGTALPYIHTTSSDWWISQPGKLYNTHQRCSSGCAFTRGDPNEHLYYETPYYNYAVVIDYNTRNAPGGVHAGAGSAFFLHVTDGAATAGCVAIPQSKLITLMRWLTPSAHPRILIGTA